MTPQAWLFLARHENGHTGIVMHTLHEDESYSGHFCMFVFVLFFFNSSCEFFFVYSDKVCCEITLGVLRDHNDSGPLLATHRVHNFHSWGIALALRPITSASVGLSTRVAAMQCC
jgi:hypothetical protein